MDKLLDVHNLRTHYFSLEGAVKAVDGVDFGIEKGETLGLAGESGCGKSTVAFSVIRLVHRPGRIVSGEIFFDGENLLEKTEEEMCKIRGKGISMVFQEAIAALNPVMNIGDQIVEAIRVHQHVSKKEAWEKMIEMLELTRVPNPQESAKKYPHELTAASMQCACIAQALSCKPKLLICDEPTTAVDLTTQAIILKLIGDLKKEVGYSILYITHNLGVLAQICDKLAIMYAGKMAEYSTAYNVFKHPKHPYTANLLKAFPRVDQVVDRLPSIPGVVPKLIEPPKGCIFHERCQFAEEICGKKMPPFMEVEPGHFVSCWLFK